MSYRKRVLNKSFFTTLISVLAVATGYLLPPPTAKYVLNMGLFAVSGAVTNWLAVYMLFERIPFLYGSGVIPARFEDFKAGIYNLIMDQFFTPENLQRFFDEETTNKDIHIAEFILDLDMERAFESLVNVIMDSSFGGMLSMFGGREALQPLKEPFTQKMHETIIELTSEESFKEKVVAKLKSDNDHDALIEKISVIVKKRLGELTPQMVKEIIQEMIREHLGWLVVWGGVFGALLGLVAAFLA